jgi:hypothetical protein
VQAGKKYGEGKQHDMLMMGLIYFLGCWEVLLLLLVWVVGLVDHLKKLGQVFTAAAAMVTATVDTECWLFYLYHTYLT